MQGNLLIAHCEYTVAGIKYGNEITLGEVTEEGGFRPFYTGYLNGKSIVVGSPVATVSSSGAPGKAAADGKRGRVNTGSTAIYADVLVGYWVWVSTINGVLVNVSVDPQYQRQLIGFKQYVNPYSSPGGGELLK